MKKLVLLSLFIFSSVAMAGAQKHAVEYRIPVAPELGSFATFHFSAKIEEDGGVVSLRYTLPLELTGVPNRVRLSGRVQADGSVFLKGPLAEGKCIDSMCELRYRNLQIDAAAVENLLRLSSRTPEEFALRWQMTQRWNEDPFGVLRFQKKPWLQD